MIIAPGFTFPAPPVKHPARLVPAVSYTAAYNVLDFPVGSVPITRVIPQDEVSLPIRILIVMTCRSRVKVGFSKKNSDSLYSLKQLYGTGILSQQARVDN